VLELRKPTLCTGFPGRRSHVSPFSNLEVSIRGGADVFSGEPLAKDLGE